MTKQKSMLHWLNVGDKIIDTVIKQQSLEGFSRILLGNHVKNYIGKTVEKIKELMSFEFCDLEAERLT